ncbi:MAG: hypothetical protein HYY18_08435 [Planctomycetes bacterium]|nr:hypothetical protein [Planctomycetota bacterium]
MYTKLCDKLVVTTAGSPEFSFAVPMDGNALQLEVTVISVVAGATLSLEVQGTNDLQNYFSILGPVAGLTVGYKGDAAVKATGVAYQYVRVKWTSVGVGGAVVLAAGINTSQL